MSAVKTDKDLIFAAARVSFRAPQEWASFISTLAAHVETKRNECISAPLDMLQVAQGRAQAWTAVHDMFVDCINTAKSIEAKQNQKPQQPR